MTNRKPKFRPGDLLAHKQDNSSKIQILITKVHKNSYEYYHCYNGTVSMHSSVPIKRKSKGIDLCYMRYYAEIKKIINYNSYWAKLNEA